MEWREGVVCNIYPLTTKKDNSPPSGELPRQRRHFWTFVSHSYGSEHRTGPNHTNQISYTCELAVAVLTLVLWVQNLSLNCWEIFYWNWKRWKAAALHSFYFYFHGTLFMRSFFCQFNCMYPLTEQDVQHSSFCWWWDLNTWLRRRMLTPR